MSIKAIRDFGLLDESQILDGKALMSAFVAKGWTKIGQGFFSSVFSHPESKKVIKIFNKSRDPGGYSWTIFSYLFGKADPHFVRIYDFAEVNVKENLKKGRWVYSYEKNEKLYAETDIPNTNVYCIVVMEKLIENSKKIMKICKALNGRGRDWEGTARFRKYCEALANAAQCTVDIHSGNVMFRNCGTWVLTDPLAYGQTPLSCPNMLTSIKATIDSQQVAG